MYVLSPSAKKQLKTFEGLRLHAYLCPAGKWTIGYGHRIKDGEPHVISLMQAERYLVDDINRVLCSLEMTDRLLSQNQVDALVMFIFNIGVGAWLASEAFTDLITGKTNLIPFQLKRWVHDDHGNVIPGLVTRRNYEAELFGGKAA